MNLRTWRMFLASLLLVLCAPSTQAQTDAASKPPPVPDPLELRADWWAYFESVEAGEVAARAETFQQRLDELVATLPVSAAGAGEAHGLVSEIRSLLDALVDTRESEAAKALAPELSSSGPYRLAQLLALAVQRQELELEAELAATEVRESENLVRAAKQSIDTAMAAYLTDKQDSAARLLAGLSIVRDRILWALSDLDLRRHRERERNLLAARKQLDDRLADGRKAFVGDQAALDRWREDLAKANEALRETDAQALAVRTRLAVLGTDARGQAQRRVQQQKLLNLEAQRLTQEMTAAMATVGISLINGAMGQTVDAQALRDERDALGRIVDNVVKKRPVWRRVTDRERVAATAQLAADGGFPSVLVRARAAQVEATTQTLATLARELARAQALVDIAAERLAALSGTVGDLAAETLITARDVWTRLVELGGASLFTINETPVTTFGLVRLTMILLVAWGMSRLVHKGLQRLGRRETMTRASIYTLSRLFHYVILLIGFLVALSSIGIDFTKFALIASAFGVGLGFGLQAIFSNFVAGLIILFERSLKVGDFVELESGVGGEVQAINIRSTLITTNDNVDILVPNSEFVNGRVTNWTMREAFRRIHVPFGVAYGSDKERVRTAALEAAREVAHTLAAPNRDPRVWLVGFGDSSLNFELVVWLTPDAVKRPTTVHADYCWAIESALARHGLEIPFPQRDLHLRSVFGRKDERGLELLDANRTTPSGAP